MSIYSIRRDIDNFKVFTVDDSDIYEKMEDFDIHGFGKALEFNWVSPVAFFIDNDSKSEVIPDISLWFSTNLVLSSKAKKILDPLVGKLGEYLSVDGQCNDYSMLNLTSRIGNEVVDLEKTKHEYYDDGSWKRIEKLVFVKNADSITPSLFSIEMDRGITLFCNQTFKDEVEKHSLKGLIFSVIEQG